MSKKDKSPDKDKDLKKSQDDEKGTDEQEEKKPQPKEKSPDKDKSKSTSKEQDNKTTEENKRLKGQVSELSKQIGQLKQQLTGIAQAVNPEQEGDEEVTLESLQGEVEAMKQENQRLKTEKEKNSYINGLENVSEARKKYLRGLIKADSDDWKKQVDTEVERLNQLLDSEEQSKTAPDERPTSQGSGTPSSGLSANEILEKETEDSMRKKASE